MVVDQKEGQDVGLVAKCRKCHCFDAARLQHIDLIVNIAHVINYGQYVQVLSGIAFAAGRLGIGIAAVVLVLGSAHRRAHAQEFTLARAVRLGNLLNHDGLGADGHLRIGFPALVVHVLHE